MIDRVFQGIVNVLSDELIIYFGTLKLLSYLYNYKQTNREKRQENSELYALNGLKMVVNHDVNVRIESEYWRDLG